VFNRTSMILVIAGFACLAVSACGDSDSPSKPNDPQRDSGTEAADAAVEDGGLTKPDHCDSVAPRECPSPSPRWADVSPIFMKRCVSCHNGAGEQWPLNAYEHVADWYGEIRAQMLMCTMPPVEAGIDMPVAERQTILSWIRCGFPK
jgi:hypothetical protein